MIVTVAPEFDPGRVKTALVQHGLWVERMDGEGRVQFAVEPHSSPVDRAQLCAIEGVELVTEASSIHPLVDEQPRVVDVRGQRIGVGAPPAVFAGPCSVESEEAIRRIASKLAPAGVGFLRGGAFKPRTSPYSFRGHGRKALRWLSRAAHENGMALVTELMSERERDEVSEFADMIQIGSRNMHNYALLEHAAGAKKPIFLKRGMAATVEEWLASGEYCLMHGAPSVVYCERGIRSFDPSTRNLVDLGAVALLSSVHQLPIVVDPSHGVGRRDLVPALARASIAAGAHGVMIETHDRPGDALSDGPQAVSIEAVTSFAESLRSKS